MRAGALIVLAALGVGAGCGDPLERYQGREGSGGLYPASKPPPAVVADEPPQRPVANTQFKPIVVPPPQPSQTSAVAPAAPVLSRPVIQPKEPETRPYMVVPPVVADRIEFVQWEEAFWSDEAYARCYAFSGDKSLAGMTGLRRVFRQPLLFVTLYAGNSGLQPSALPKIVAVDERGATYLPSAPDVSAQDAYEVGVVLNPDSHRIITLLFEVPEGKKLKLQIGRESTPLPIRMRGVPGSGVAAVPVDQLPKGEGSQAFLINAYLLRFKVDESNESRGAMLDALRRKLQEIQQ